jgi:SMC interacting uncharacterized protein involved in chromosome segregation
MATLEERVQALEQDHAQLKKTIELQTIAIRALISKEAFEKLQDTVEKLQETLQEAQEQNGKLFNVLINQGATINNRITDQYTELEGKIVGLQTETRQHFAEQDEKIVGLQTETRQRFTTVETMLAQILTRLPEKP